MAHTKERQDTRMCFRSMQAAKAPSQMFADMCNLASMVAKRISPSMVVTGDPGLGKTFNVIRTLRDQGLTEGTDFVHVKGRATAAGMFITLFENADKMIIFDDCDSVFRDTDAVNILKGALDSYDRRVISWMAAKPLKDSDGEPLPRSFEFRGQIIFISNVSITGIDSAIRSRSFVIDIALTAEQMIQRMRDLLPEVEPGVPGNIKMDALDGLRHAYERYQGVELNFRSLIKAIRIRQAGFENWRDMIAEQVMGV
jgi:hypothetical protein